MFNPEKLRAAQARFFMEYPGGFANEELVNIGKKHRMDTMVAMAQDSFTPAACLNVDKTIDAMIKVVSRSSMVSMFEKPKYRDTLRALPDDDRAFLVQCLSELLHGKQSLGFAGMADLLRLHKLAKWSLLTIIPAYYAPTVEVFIKPTTVKGILAYFEMAEPVYKPAPSWAFYETWRGLINAAKQQVDSSLSPSNAAFSGFLMMALNLMPKR